jgi:hypothetical protein
MARMDFGRLVVDLIHLFYSIFQIQDSPELVRIDIRAGDDRRRGLFI